MSWLAPPRLLLGIGIDDPTDPHLAAAAHIRLFPHPRLGLPVAPITVSRTFLNQDLLRRQARHDITWVGANGQVLTPPFNVTPGNPVTGHLPSTPGSRCIWLQVDATPQRFPGPIGGVIEPGPILVRPVIPGPVIFRPVGRPPLDPVVIRPLPFLLGGLDVAQIESTTLGPTVVQHRSTAPYQLAASVIERIRISGSGVVRGVTWLDAVQLQKEQPKLWKRWALPHPDAARYVSMPNPEGAAKDRVAAGAPLREALYDAPSSTPPSAPPIADPPGHEVNRVVKRYSGDLEKALDRLVSDTSQPASDLTEPIPSRDEITHQVVGTINMNLLATVQMAAIDPGMSRWLGLADVDPEVRHLPAGTLALYWLDGWWDGDGLGKETLLGRIFARTLPEAGGDPKIFEKMFDRKPPPGVGRMLNLGTIVPLIVGVPPDRPNRPGVGALHSGPWNTELVPPAAARQVTLPLAGLMPANQLAFARVGPGGPLPLHEKGPDGGMLPISAAVLPDAVEPGQGEVYDRMGPPDATRYRLAQADWFGRWSEWSEGLIGAASRPRPPRPVPEMFYEQPALPDPMHDLPLSGTIRIRVGVPLAAQLPPGSLLVDTLEVALDGGPVELVGVLSGSVTVDLTRSGPALARCGTGAIRLTCRWRDTAGQFSDPSPEIGRSIKDPRPPAAVVLPETLSYGSRPDVTGKSRIQLRWAPSAGQSFSRVYHTDETTLLTALERAGASTLAIRTAIAAAPDAAARAAIFVANKARFEKAKFESVGPEGFTGSALEHRVSGSLRVLVFYRVVPISASNVEGPFGDSSMVPFGIPNSGSPATPLLAVKPLFESGVAQAAIHIRVPQGQVQASEYRLRRSAVESRIVERMPVARSGAVPLLPGGAGPEAMQEVVSFRDVGGSELKPTDPLRPWTAYSWAVEVRGAPEPGSSVSGEWSPPSAPVTTAVIPSQAPLAPQDGQWNGANEISFSHPESLIGGSMGSYAVDLYCELPGKPLTFFRALSADAPASAGGRQPDRSGRFRFDLGLPPVSGTRFRAMVTDPAGRTSPPSGAVVIP